MTARGFVYLLGTYDEYGPLNLVAAQDREKLPGLLKGLFEKLGWTIGDEEMSLTEALLSSDEALSCGRTTLTGAWGGVQLHVVRL